MSNQEINTLLANYVAQHKAQFDRAQAHMTRECDRLAKEMVTRQYEMISDGDGSCRPLPTDLMGAVYDRALYQVFREKFIDAPVPLEATDSVASIVMRIDDGHWRLHEAVMEYLNTVGIREPFVEWLHDWTLLDEERWGPLVEDLRTDWIAHVVFVSRFIPRTAELDTLFGHIVRIASAPPGEFEYGDIYYLLIEFFDLLTLDPIIAANPAPRERGASVVINA